MKILAIIQARISSERFPGKVLYKVNGKPLIWYLYKNISNCNGLDGIIVATSEEKSDDPIYDYCKANDINCYRGSLKNVSQRFIEIINIYDISAFIRLSGDSPLLDLKVVENGLAIFNENRYDIVTNVLNRTYPKGQSVEIFKTDIFLNASSEIIKSRYCEHVTNYFYEHKHRYKIYNFTSGMEMKDIQLSVDTEEDMKCFEKIIKKMDRPHWNYTWKDIIGLKNRV